MATAAHAKAKPAKPEKAKSTDDWQRRAVEHPRTVFKRQGYHPVFNPRPDERRGDPTPGRNGNCGPASLAMAAKAYGLEPRGLSIEDTIDRARNAMTGKKNFARLGEPDNNAATDRADHERGAKTLGLKARKVAPGWQGIDKALAGGHMVLVGGVPGNPRSSKPTAYERAMRKRGGKSDYAFDSGHAILVMGRTKDGGYVVGDPLARKPVTLSKEEMRSLTLWWGTEVWR